MSVQINAKPLAGFDRPIDMMIDCHRRIEHFLDVLVRVVERYTGHVLDAEGRQALGVAREYFANSAPQHTADEEQTLFPRMFSADAADPAIRGALEQLRQEHETAEDLHARVDRLLDQWLAARESLPADRLAKLRADLATLRNLYATHTHLEEEQIFPSAAKLLSDGQLREVGEEMRTRRGLVT
jgi:hemerythrin-like domain-containing protein